MSIFTSIQTRGSSSSEYRKGWRTILLNIVLMFLAGFARKHGFEVDTSDLAVVIGGNTGLAASYGLSRTAVKRAKIARDRTKAEAQVLAMKAETNTPANPVPRAGIPEPIREPFPRPGPGVGYPSDYAEPHEEPANENTLPHPAYFGS